MLIEIFLIAVAESHLLHRHLAVLSAIDPDSLTLNLVWIGGDRPTIRAVREHDWVTVNILSASYYELVATFQDDRKYTITWDLLGRFSEHKTLKRNEVPQPKEMTVFKFAGHVYLPRKYRLTINFERDDGETLSRHVTIVTSETESCSIRPPSLQTEQAQDAGDNNDSGGRKKGKEASVGHNLSGAVIVVIILVGLAVISGEVAILVVVRLRQSKNTLERE
jgi:hypothetical protein